MFLTAGGPDGGVRLWSLDDKGHQHRLQLQVSERTTVIAVAVDMETLRVAAGYDSGLVRVYDMLGITLVAKFEVGGVGGGGGGGGGGEGGSVGVSALRWVGGGGAEGTATTGGKILVVGDEGGHLSTVQFRDEGEGKVDGKLAVAIETAEAGLGGRVVALEVCPSDPNRFVVVVASWDGGSRVVSYGYEHDGQGSDPCRTCTVRAEGSVESASQVLACYSPFRHHQGHLLVVETGAAVGAVGAGAAKPRVLCVSATGEEIEVVAELGAYVSITAIAGGMVHGQPTVCLGTASGELLLLLHGGASARGCALVALAPELRCDHSSRKQQWCVARVQRGGWGKEWDSGLSIALVARVRAVADRLPALYGRRCALGCSLQSYSARLHTQAQREE